MVAGITQSQTATFKQNSIKTILSFLQPVMLCYGATITNSNTVLRLFYRFKIYHGVLDESVPKSNIISKSISFHDPFTLFSDKSV